MLKPETTAAAGAGVPAATAAGVAAAATAGVTAAAAGEAATGTRKGMGREAETAGWSKRTGGRPPGAPHATP